MMTKFFNLFNSKIVMFLNVRYLFAFLVLVIILILLCLFPTNKLYMLVYTFIFLFTYFPLDRFKRSKYLQFVFFLLPLVFFIVKTLFPNYTFLDTIYCDPGDDSSGKDDTSEKEGSSKSG